MRTFMWSACTIWMALMCAHPVGATTVRPISFSELARGAVVVVEGTVIATEVVSTGRDQRPGEHRGWGPDTPKGRQTAAPAKPQAEGAAVQDAGTAPVSVGVEGGKMLHTEVTLAVDRQEGTGVGPTVKFRVAGGVKGGTKVVVFGMPTFEVGKRYVVFLRPGFEASSDPIVGVHQGYFEVLERDTAGDVLLNAKGDIVIGLSNDRVIVRRNPDRAPERASRMGPPPVPDAGSDARVRVSPQVERYWLSQEPPMSLDDFFTAVRSAREDAR